MKKYIVSHWRGEQRLWVSFWINGFLLYIAACALLVLMGEVANMHVLLGLSILICLMVWQITEIVRCAVNRLRGETSIFGKAMAVTAVAAMLAVVYFGVKDLIGLGIIGL